MAQQKKNPKRRSVSSATRKNNSASKKKVKRPQDQRKNRSIGPRVLLGCLAIILVASAVLLAWERWFRYDDIADIQGAWRLSNTTVIVSIDSDEIVLSPDVRYQYTLDTGAKIVDFTFDNLRGSGRYQFSPDRTILIIVDGEPSDILGDFARTFGFKPFDEVAEISNLSYMTRVSNVGS